MSTYSFLDFTATLAGITGLVDLSYGAAHTEEGADVKMAGDKNTMTIGADGEGMHSLHADKSGQITFRLLQTSPVNAKLQAMYDAQSLSATLWGKNVIVIRQTAAGDIVTARDCAFKKLGDLPYKKVGQFLEWAFDCIKIDRVLGTY